MTAEADTVSWEKQTRVTLCGFDRVQPAFDAQRLIVRLQLASAPN